MLSFFFTLFALVSFTLALPHPNPNPNRSLSARYFPQGTITSPANGTAIAPGAAFDFSYNPRSDYCVYAHNFSVWLLAGSTTDSSSSAGPSTPAEAFGMLLQNANGGDGESDGTGPTGYYFGRFSASSSINEYPTNAVPSTLTMPDFSNGLPFGGTGVNASDVSMYLLVLEEWNDCGAFMGSTFSLAVNSVVYNSTNTTSTPTSSASSSSSSESS